MTDQHISHYKILDKLGEGGMGVVYKARDTRLDRTVALKFLAQHLTSSEEDKQRFIREAKAAAALNHPNICSIYSINDHEGQQFIEMEYIEGETLREKIDAGDLTLETALDYAAKIADALSEAHQNNIIHRDIKPENIMVDAKGRIKVMDFGLAKLKHAHDITKTGSTVGTLAYMSPEQIRGKAVDHRSDLFSFGIVFYEMLTGQKPFRGEHEAAMTYAIVNEEPAPIQLYLAEAPKKLVKFFDQVLAKEPEERIGSATEVADLLKGVKESADINPTQSSPAVAESESKDKDSDNSTTISLTIPNFGFGKKSIGKAGLLASTIAVLALVLFIGWWLVGGNASEDNSIISTGSSDSVITNRSIAVLPFTNQGGGEEVASITQGLHDDLLTRLSNIGDLQVTSGTSVEQYRNTELSLPLIADSLGVQWIVEGGVQEAGGRIRVNAQLIDPQGDTHVWADSYRRMLSAENLFDIQGEIAGEIANALQAELTEAEQKRIAGAPTGDLNAFHLYAQGRQELAKRTFGIDEHVKKAVDYFHRAIQEDSSFALAWTGLADAAATGLYVVENPDSASIFPVDQETAARRALEIDPDLAEAHASMGFAELRNMNAPVARKHLQRAIELKPSYWQAHHLLGELYLHIGRSEQALDHLKLAVELNPNHAQARHWLYDAYNTTGQPQKSLQEARRQQKMGLESSGAIGGEIRALYSLGRFEDARKLAEDQIRKFGAEISWGNWLRVYLIRILSAEGDTVQARKYLEQLKTANVTPTKLASAYRSLGMTDEALTMYQQLDDQDWRHVAAIGGFRTLGSEYPSVRGDSRYKELSRKINLAWGLNADGSFPEEMETM